MMELAVYLRVQDVVTMPQPILLVAYAHMSQVKVKLGVIGKKLRKDQHIYILIAMLLKLISEKIAIWL
jgi:hypothetical protein